MKNQLIFRGTSKLIGFSMLCFTLLSLLFLLTYVIVDYKAYARNYKITQMHEIDAVKLKANVTLNQLERTLRLIESRILAAGGNETKIQEILRSLHHIQNIQTLPEIQRISYNKLSSPQVVITRFGILPLDSQQLFLEMEFLKKQGSLTNITNNGLIDRLFVWDVDGNLEGMLEIQIPLDELWNFLGSYSTVHFDDEFLKHGTQNLIKGRLFPILKKPDPTFFAYITQHLEFYRGLGIYFLFSFLLLGACIYILSLCFYRRYERRVVTLEEDLVNSNKREKQLSECLENIKRRLDNHFVSCQLHRKFQRQVKDKQIEFANSLIESLTICQSTLKDNYSSMNYTEYVEFLETCKHKLINLAMGIWYPTDVEKMDITEIICNISTLFIEKIEASNITLQMINGSEAATSYEGDSLFVEFILINIIGKRLYRVPKNGKMLISLKEKKEGISIEIKDNCYRYNTKNRFEFFIDDVIFQQLCSENCITYTTTNNKAGDMNVTHIMLPFPQTESLKNNVVPLFK